MSFPNIPNVTPSISINRADVVNLLLVSIAFEELGLAHVINAEAEKLQAVLGTLPGSGLTATSISQLLSVNQSVNRTLKTVLKTQMLLQFKLEDVMSIPITPPNLIFENIATLTGSAPPDISVLITDDAFFNSPIPPINNGYTITASLSAGAITVQGPSVGLLKEVSVDNGVTFQESQFPPGPTLPTGSKPWFRFTVTNDGTVAFLNATLTDTVVGTISMNFPSLPGTIVQFVAKPL